MRKMIISLSAILALGAASAIAIAQDRGARAHAVIEPKDLGVVTAAGAGSTAIALENVPAVIKHTAMVSFKSFDGSATVTGAQVDMDEIAAVYEVSGRTSGGQLLEIDILPDGTVEELEVEISADQVPERVRSALGQFAPQFKPAAERPAIEKSIRPSKNGLPEIWYEFGGKDFDVEIRSDGRALLIEPA